MNKDSVVAQGTHYAEDLRWLANNREEVTLTPERLEEIALFIESLAAQVVAAQHACDVAGADPEHALDAQIIELRDQNAALSAQVAAGNVVIECCYEELKKALGRDIECPAYIPDAIRELSAQVVESRRIQNRVDKNEVWHWQGDGEDFPESLGCPVIMSADALRALLAQVVELQQENKRHAENYAQDCVVMTRYVPAFGRLSDAINQLGQHSSVTRASVPPSVSDGGT